jgi:carbamoyl-phosphate synthase large subunit
MKEKEKLLILGSGPIKIGQACEFDYSGTQACKALKERGFEVILINSNPATIMTDPNIADKVYIEPLEKTYVEAVIKKERPHKLIPTLGGQTALNLALELDASGILKKYDLELIGATPEVIKKAEDRQLFNDVLTRVGANFAKSFMATSFEQGLKGIKDFEFPVILRPNYTLGGGGGGVCYSLEEYRQKLSQGLHESPTSEVLVEQSLLGWKEFELEVMRDKEGTFVIICSIENIDPCGVHTGDSITVAPQQTLSDKAYQEMRTEAKKIVEEVGVETGGANIQFAVHPTTGERIVIEMNPRVSRSSALASKATGFPIAKIAALLAVGETLDELKNDITKTTPSSYEPALDYVVTKIPKFNFEKFLGSKDQLSTQMKSVGEVMSLGRTFKESFVKAFRSLEGDDLFLSIYEPFDKDRITYPNSQRMIHLFRALAQGVSVEELYDWTKITPWFLEQFSDIVKFYDKLSSDPQGMYKEAKRMGLSDAQIKGASLQAVELPDEAPSYFQVDTCAGEFKSSTPYLYSTHWSKSGVDILDSKSEQKTYVVIGSGPNRIGQGIEFDYCCVRAVEKLKALGHRVVMINSNPETVSTDYDTSDVLFFEPLDEEGVLNVLRAVKPEAVFCQFGGQTPIHLARAIQSKGYHLAGTPLSVIDQAEDRHQFAKVCERVGAKVPKSTLANSFDELDNFLNEVPYPLMCRPSYVIGGQSMEVVENDEDLSSYFLRHERTYGKTNPCFVDQFLEGALEVDVDLVCFKDRAIVAGIVEHIEVAGVHSGDSMGVLPPQRLKADTRKTIEETCLKLANVLGVRGLLNVQLAIKNNEVFIIEANPRASRTIPFIAKAKGVSFVDYAVLAMLGENCPQELIDLDWAKLDTVCVKGVVFPFKKFPDSDSILGPQMKSTGESMGRGADYPTALLKAFMGADYPMPQSGRVFLSLRDKDKHELIKSVKILVDLGFSLLATKGTAKFLKDQGLECESVNKVLEGRPHCVDRIRSGDVAIVFNTTSGKDSIKASYSIRRSCLDFSVPCLTESEAAKAYVLALRQKKAGQLSVLPLSLSL